MVYLEIGSGRDLTTTTTTTPITTTTTTTPITTTPPRSTRRAMLRRIAGVRRAPDEDYVDWIKRGTQKAEAIAASSRVREWTKTHYSMKWSWAGHVARRPTDSWIWRTTSWRDSEWQGLLDESTSCTRPLRPSRRRWTRWEDGLRRFCAARGFGKWQALAQNRELWPSFTF